jgi:hypothetical protein
VDAWVVIRVAVSGSVATLGYKIHTVAGTRGRMGVRPALQHALFGLGVVCLVAATLVGGGPADPDYVHHVEVAGDGTLAYGLSYEADDVVAYRTLSARGRQVFDRARADSPYVVENGSATAPEFSYTDDYVAVGSGLYPIRHEGTVYSLRTERAAADAAVAALFVRLALRGVGILLVVAGVLLTGWRRYQRGVSSAPVGATARVIVFIATVYRWFADPFRRTTGNDLR